MEVNCSSMKSADEWIPKFLAALQLNKHVTYFFDEFHALPTAVSDWLLTALDPDKVSKVVEYGQVKATLDFRKSSFIAATTEPQKVFIALANRFQSLELVDYTRIELSSIIQAEAGGASWLTPQEVYLYLADLSRGNGRSASDLAREIVRFKATRHLHNFTMEHARELVSILDIFPLGLSRAEFNMLKIISERPNVSLTTLCAMTGLTRPAQQESEQFLMKRGLIDIDKGSKRILTKEGVDYLAEQGVVT